MIDRVQELSERNVLHLYIAANRDNHIDRGLQGKKEHYSTLRTEKWTLKQGISKLEVVTGVRVQFELNSMV